MGSSLLVSCFIEQPKFIIQQLKNKLVVKIGFQFGDRQANLVHGVSFANGHAPVIHRLEIKGNTIGRTDLILAAIAPAD